MAALTAQYFPPLCVKFREALTSEVITLEEAYDFAEEIYNIYLEDKVRRGQHRTHPQLIDGGQDGKRQKDDVA